jgi:hypothetical protein
VPSTDPAGLAGQAAALGQAGGTGAGNTVQNIAGAGSQTMPGGMDAASMLSMGPQLVGAIPQVLQGVAQPFTQGMGSPLQSLGGFQSLLSPFMGAFNNPGLFGAGTGAAGAIPAAVGPAAAAGANGLGGLGAGGGAVSAAVGRAGSLGGLSVPATWAASAQTGGAAGEPVTVGASAPQAAAPASTGAGMGGGAPLAAMAGREASTAGGPRYGTPIRVLPRPR